MTLSLMNLKKMYFCYVTYFNKYVSTVCVILGLAPVLLGQNAVEKTKKYINLFTEYEYEDTLKARTYSDSAVFFAELSGDPEMMGKAYQYKGWYFQNTTQFLRARKCFYRSLESFRKTTNRQFIADAYGNLGNSFLDTYEYTESLDCQMKSLKVNEEILASAVQGKKRETALTGKTYALHNIGAIYNEVGLYKKAIEFYRMSLASEVLAKNKEGEAISCSSLGQIYKAMEIRDSAVYYFKRGISIFEKEVSNSYELAEIYLEYSTLKNANLSKEESRAMLNKALEMYRNISDKDGEMDALIALGENYFDDLSKDSLRTIVADCDVLINRYDLLTKKERFLQLKARYLSRIGKHSEANRVLNDYIAFLNLREEEKKGRDLIISDVKYEMQEKLINDSLQLSKAYDIERAIDQEKISQQARLITLGVIGGVGLLALLVVLVRSNRRRQRMNEVLSEKNQLIQQQKEMADIRNREISDSIKYATRLQSAILPKHEEFEACFEDSFVLYRPKDLVSGDFYWLETIGDLVFLAVGDCTGHGVPGAMVSVVCNNALNRSIHEFELRLPDEIMNKTRELVIETFAKSEDYVDDGMDIALCVINRGKRTIQFTGANNPLWIVKEKLDKTIDSRRVTEGSNALLFEISGDKQPVGKYPKMDNFTRHEIRYSEGDRIYLCSDGFADQFGGMDGKKFRSSAMKNIVLEIHSNEMGEQFSRLLNEFDSWKGEQDQVDDVCLVGIKL